MGIKVTFLGDEPSTKDAPSAPAILIPQSAVHDEGGKKVVFLLRGEKAERRAVTLGGGRGSDAEVIAGVAAGDTVIVNGPADLHDGQSVQTRK
jgi:multidrug efflux pump subunit AcrA (membrane-fusion protein)